MEKCHKCNSSNIKISKSYNHFDVFYCKTCGYWTYKKILECCREPFEIIVVKHHINTSFLYKQCINCGGSVNRNKPLSHRKYGEMIRDEFNDYRFNEWHENIEKERQVLAELKQSYNYYNSPKYKYYKYLTSFEWKEIRQKVLNRDKNLCQICKKKDADEVHHLTYENLGKEKLDDLIAICRECHMKIHNIKNE